MLKLKHLSKALAQEQMQERALWLVANNASPLRAQDSVRQARSCEWTNCPTRVGDVCCNDRNMPQPAA